MDLAKAENQVAQAVANTSSRALRDCAIGAAHAVQAIKWASRAEAEGRWVTGYGAATKTRDGRLGSVQRRAWGVIALCTCKSGRG
jgi:hypothetical protein